MANRILISGARSIEDRDNIYAHLDQMLGMADGAPSVDVIISGGQKGVDKLAEDYARENDIAFVLFKPYHLLDSQAKHETRHYFVRNKAMVDNSDMVIVFHDGKDSGTEDIINYTRKRNKTLVIIDPEHLNITERFNG
jgi:predicted Rossmann-fold nucleotide-binding protein